MPLRDALVFATAKVKSFGGFDLAIRYNPATRRRVRNMVRTCREGDPHQRRVIVDGLTAAIIKRARMSRYGESFGLALWDWPVLHKQKLRESPLAFATPSTLRVPAATGGTTGVPIRLTRSPRSIAAEQVFLDDLIAPHGLTWARARVAVLRGDPIKPTDENDPPFARETHWGRRLVLSSPHLTAQSLPWYLDRLARFRPDILYIYPTVAANLLKFIAQSGRSLRVPLIVTSSERLEPGLRRGIEQELEAIVIDYYGQAERVAFAISHEPERYAFDPAYGRVELPASEDDEVVGDRRFVPIIATGFWNEALPLIRYYTGDRAMVPAQSSERELEAIAMGEQPFFGIAGRDDEFIFAPDGRRLGGLHYLPREVSNLLRIQLVQDTPEHVALRALATAEFGRADRARLLANARAKIPSSIAIELDVVDRLETTSAGKTPFVIRRLGLQ